MPTPEQPTDTPQAANFTMPPPAANAPTVVQRSPAQGEALQPGGAVMLTFDRPMEQSSVEAALKIVPAVAGKATWPDARTVVFQPAQPLPRGASYHVALGAEARGQDGAAMADPVRFQFDTSGYLEVGQVIPADGTADAATTSAITVVFTRPVVPLTLAEQQGSLAQPLSFDPPIAGSGRWVNTAIYTFTPSQPLRSGASYTARVDADLKDALGNPMNGAFAWSFSTARPQVLTISPQQDASGVSVEPSIQVQFNGPVESSIQQAIALRGPDSGAVPFRSRYLTDTVVLTPEQRLAFDTSYQVFIPAGAAASAGGAGLSQDFVSAFRTAPLPKIIGTAPTDGQQNVSAWSDFAILFNAPIDPDTVMPHLQFTPQISATQVYSYFDTGSNSFHIGLGQMPSTDVTVQISPGIADPFGNIIDQSLTVRFRTAPLPASIYALDPTVSTLTPSTRAQIRLQATNTSAVDLALFRLSQDVLKEQLYTLYNDIPSGAQQIRSWQAQLNAPADIPTMNAVDLVEQGGTLEPGIYLVQIKSPANSAANIVFIVSPINLTVKASQEGALVWANQVQGGAPVANLAVDIYQEGQPAQLLGSLTTGADGVGQLALSRSDDTSLIAIAKAPFAAMGNSWSEAVSRWEFQPNGQDFSPGAYAYVYTDRPIYRPGQQVHFKGMVRDQRDASFSMPKQASATVTVSSPTGESIFTKDVQLSATGTFTGELALGSSAALGSYQIGVQIGDRGFSYSFEVAAYRAPEFEVAVTPGKAEAFRGETASADVAATYLFGGPVANAQVSWNVLAEPYQFAPDWASLYQFGDEQTGGVFCFDCWWRPMPQPEPILSGSGTTDSQGKLHIEVPASALDTWAKNRTTNGSLGDSKLSAKLTIEAVATGRDNQAIAGRGEVVVHTADVYVGLAAQNYLGQAGKPQSIDLVAASSGGTARPKQSIALEFQRVTWENREVNDAQGRRWESIEKVEPAGSQNVTTDGSGQATATFTPASGGSYRVVARASDAGGRETRSVLSIWVADSSYIPWMRGSSERITLVADKTSYAPGETASVLIPSPFQGEHWALITVERAGVRSYEVRKVESNSIIYQLPISAEMAPNIYIAVTLFKGGEADQLADIKFGVLPITVSTAQQTLGIQVVPSAPQAEPGAAVGYDVSVTNAAGQGVAAELSLDLVDRGVLSLAPRRANDIGETLYAKRGLGVSTASALSLSSERLWQQVARPGNLGQGGGPASDLAVGAAPTAAAAAPMAESADSAKGRSQAPQAAAPTVRENFADTAYWNGVVTTDAQGKAHIELKLPDNLTTWVMRGVGITSDSKVGEGISNIVATKSLLIRPVTPRFFTVGDRAQLAANISNNTDAPLDATVGISATGLTFTDELTKTVQVPARGEAQVTWLASAQDAAGADLTFRAVAGQYSDASKPPLASANGGLLPIYRYSAPEMAVTGGQISQAGSRGEAIALPPNIDASQGELTVRIDPSLAAGMRDSLTYLEHYEYECAEQTVSRFLPNVLTAQALKELGIPNAELEARLPALVAEGVDRLTAQQNSDGGWGWWPQGQSNPHISAYVVLGLAKARAAGYAVPDELLSRGQDYLAGQLKATSTDTERLALSEADANQQSFLLFALAESGKGDRTKAGELAQVREKLATYARSLLAMALHTSGASADDAQIKALLADLNTSAIMSATGAHWEEQSRDWWSMNTDTRSTAITLEALTRLAPSSQINAQVVRWLMVARKGGIWQTTQENAWSLMALTSWMRQTGELKSAYDYGVQLNGKPIASGHISPEQVSTPVVTQVQVADLLRDASNQLLIGRGDGQGQLYYSAQLRAFLPVADIKALDRGISVQRRYTLASCTPGEQPCPEVREVKAGDVVRVELSVVAASDLHYLAIEDPLPAGFEAIDPSLATTSVLAEGPSTGRPEIIPLDDTVGVVAPTAKRFILPWERWYVRTELRDEKVALFSDYLGKGAYTFSYTIRATQAGEYRAIPTTAYEMYFPDVYGRADGAVLTVK